MGTAEARTANRLTYEFVSIASHELRAPIAVVHGIAATLDARVDELPDEQVHALLRQLVVQSASIRSSGSRSCFRGSWATAPRTCAWWPSPAR